MKLALAFVVFFTANLALAEEKQGWEHESTLGVVKVGGNSNSESYNGKQKTVYTINKNALTLTGQYLETKTTGVQTAKAWDAALRYEFIISAWWSAFLQHGAESDSFAGYTQRDNSDIGAKYFIIQDDNEKLFTEAGYRYTKTLSSQAAPTKYESYGRSYIEYTRKFNDSVSGKVWVEYLPNFSDSEAYLVNYEPSVTVLMNSLLSLKVAYLVKYHNKTLTLNEKKEDTTFTTALVAKF
ncbi:MAG: DUF481 domain-containing protein [Bdellovibrio sp.]|nr:DUF481 domain-containing protein [Bdellovibrio sp.]